ncbi:unnamed protein product [Phytomonas sp. EM1]|nr:unnamed protein product [Phytomonas sp. EM1]|eukprot:CCW64444.1 unnamed protein product [Phytomonas sp. isolate EM1]
MQRRTLVLLRRGKPRPRASMFPDKYRRVPSLLKPQQGGQQYFSEFLIRTANEEVLRSAPDASDEARSSGIHPRLPQQDLQESIARTTRESIAEDMKQLIEQDAFSTTRGFNQLQWYEQEHERLHPKNANAAFPEQELKESSHSDLPERVLGEDYFKDRYGYSLLKDSTTSDAADASIINYSQLDLWGEMPKYHRDMVFLYLVSRRRNTYAVAYNYEGKRLLTTYTAGNRGLKGGDRGFRADGSTDNGHQVTSMYLNDLLPKIREQRAADGRPMQRNEKIELVVRVMGFYNGRQGAVRAVQDRSADFVVRYIEDITPFPLNGPKMPRGVFK